MTDLKDYFDPVSIERSGFEHLAEQAGFPHNITVNTENSPVRDTGRFKIALFGVPEGRNSPGTGTMKGPDSIREQLYRLARIPGKLKIVDLGNMKKGVTFNDTIAGLTDILCWLAGENIFPVIIGGSSALVSAIDSAFTRLKTRYSLIAVDPRIDFINESREADSFNYLSNLLHSHKSTFSQYINI